jgi:hypothetical protein
MYVHTTWFLFSGLFYDTFSVSNYIAMTIERLVNEQFERPYNHNAPLSTLLHLSQFTSTDITFIARMTVQPAALFIYNL